MAEPETLLRLGIDAAREGNREEARNLFSLLTRQEPDNVQAWLWLAGVAEGPEQRRAALERVLELDPDNEMAIKGLHAMGVPLPKRGNQHEPVTPPPSPAPATSPASEAPEKPAAAMSDEEQFAAELDAAFEDYDALPRAAPPPRPEQPPEEAGKLPPMPPRTSPVPPRAASSSSRVSATRASDDDEEEPPRRGPSPLLWVLLGIIALVLIVFLVIQLFFPPGAPGPVPPTQVVEQPTAPGAAPTPGDQAAQPGQATPEPGGVTPEPTPGEEATTAPPAEQPTPEAAPVIPPEQAQPAPVAIGTILETDGWNYTYPNQLYALPLGPRIGDFTAERGAFLHVLVFVANNTGTAQPLPRDFFVLKDAQGRVYQARPEVSSVAVRPGVNADVGHETSIPANGLTTSVYLVFDVAPDATDLMLFARNKPDQGFLVIGSVR
ncbi:MAG: tetratricopeptide repeat protein [Roseiflexus sp.]